MEKLTREEVFEKLSAERDYQEKRWESGLRERPDKEKDIGEWIIYMEFLLNAAKHQVYFLHSESAMSEIRKMTAVGVACLEIHGCPDRITSR